MDISKEDVKRKAEEVKHEIVSKILKIPDWIQENKELILVLVPAGVSLFGYGTRLYSKHQAKVRLKKEQELQDLYIYNRSLGMYHKLRKPLTTAQALEVERRRSDGEKLTSILSSMNLI